MLNPAKLLSLKKDWEAFSARHPKFVQFISTVAANGIGVGSIIDVTVKLPNGKTFQSNMRLTQEDVSFVEGFTKNM